MLCEYGCGQTAIHQFKNGKWCCHETTNSCPKLIKQIADKNRGKKRSKKFRLQMSELMMGEKNHMFGTGGYWKGKKRSNEVIKKFILSHRRPIIQIKNKYPFFSKIEEMRYNPKKVGEKEIQVRCKNNKCKNSKESNGWFTPTRNQIQERIRAVENSYDGSGCYLYCSQHCKDNCNLFNKRVEQLMREDQINTGIIKDPLYTSEEYQTFREEVLKRDNYQCVYCEEKAEHIHHTRPQKLEPFFTLDPDYGISCCRNCHYKYGHKTGTECSTGNLASKICEKG